MSELKVGLFRTVLGEDVIASYEAQEHVFVLDEALQIITQVKDGKVILSFEPYIPFASRPLFLDRGAVVVAGEARPELEAEFRRATSPIIQPNQGIVAPT